MCARLSPPGIIAFAKDWLEDETSNHHVLRELSKTRRVLWLNSIATRNPKMSSGRDLGRIRKKLAEFASGPVRVENDLWVFSPLVVPLPHLPLARRLNQRILRTTLRYLRHKLDLQRFHLWTFLPNVSDYMVGLGEELSVYYCVDEWSLFGHLDRERTVASERRLLDKVDCVFAVTDQLVAAKRSVNPETHLAPHGVDQMDFARALDPSTVVPADLAALPRPVLGFYGTLRDWVDIELIAAVARARPSWSIALIGQVLDETGGAGWATERPPAGAQAARRPGTLLQGVRRGAHSLPPERTDGIRQSHQAPRVSLGGAASRFYLGSRGRQVHRVVHDRG